MKIWVIIAGIVLANLVCAFRLSSLALSNKEKSVLRSREHEIFFRERLDIVDSVGVPIATNLTTFSMYADPTMIIEPYITAEHIAFALDGKVRSESIYDAITTENKRFIWLRRNLSPKDFVTINNLGKPGIFFVREEKRAYPHGPLLAHIVGHVDIDGKGISGVEGYFNKRLSMRTDADYVRPLALSLDVRVQHAVRMELASQILEYSATGGAAVVMDIKTGEMLAVVSLPDFDPNNMNNSKPDELFNRATLGVYEIGSVFKAWIVAFALEEKLVNLSEQFDVSTPIKVGKNHYTKDMYPIPGGVANLETIFTKSSNIGMVKVGLRLGGARIKAYLEKLGLDSMSKIEIPEKSFPLHPKRWTDVEVSTVSYGYGVAASIVHAAEAMAAIANGGRRVNATLLASSAEQEGESVISPETSSIMRKFLRRAVQDGTGRRANVSGYCVGGKTGTSNKLVAGKYDVNSIAASFAAIFPAYDPRYVVMVMIDDPKKDKLKMTGGLVAAPVAGGIIKRIVSILNIMPNAQLCADYDKST